ncbi:MAG: hypothetical protein ISQ61_00155 [SAR86 cluster bacterium]|uniref:Uncharacterized protein n=1 Tax=SAR86 cluster bacterium TaxID=2030880 RepID=A0A937IEF8_9GAMM|nr:hypothetical protein [SAR86 cluster bacterium]
MPIDNLAFTTISNVPKNLTESNAFEYIFLIPDPNEYESFSTYYQLGVMHAYMDLKIKNSVKFFDEGSSLDSNQNSFIIGPFDPMQVEILDNQGANLNLILMNTARNNMFVPPNSQAQINSLNKHLLRLKATKILLAGNNAQKNFERLDQNLDYVFLQQPLSENNIRFTLGVSQSESRYELVKEASFSKVNFEPRTRTDIDQIVIFPENEDEVYDIASNIRFNYGLNYKISILTFDLDNQLDLNEITLHQINTFDHTYENPFGYDLKKSRSYTLGYDSMLLAYAKSNKLLGELRGYGGIYTLTKRKIESSSYFN